MTSARPRAKARNLILLVIVASTFFGLIVLPYLDKGRSLKGNLAPDFALPVLDSGQGKEAEVRLSDLRGKVVLLDFWASWCGPCRQQMPILDTLADKFQQELEVIGINTGDEPGEAQRLVKALSVGYRSLDDQNGRVATLYDVNTLPTLVIIDREGKVRFVAQRVMTLRQIEAELAAL